MMEERTYHFLLITWSRVFSFGGRWGGGGILSISTCIWRGLFSSIWRVRLLLRECMVKTNQSYLVDVVLMFTTTTTDRKRWAHWLENKPKGKPKFQGTSVFTFAENRACVDRNTVSSSSNHTLSQEGTFDSIFASQKKSVSFTSLLSDVLRSTSKFVNLNLY